MMSLGNAELRVFEQAALALHSHRQRLQKLVAAMHGEALPSLLSSAGGSMLRPLRTVAEGREQARRMRPGGHPMYLLSSGSAPLEDGDVVPVPLAASDQRVHHSPVLQVPSDFNLPAAVMRL
jgi:hypothetical protein